MPCTEDGVHVEMCLNPLGVINRMNMSQLYEHELNFIADHVAKLMVDAEDVYKGFDIMLDFVEMINEGQAESMYQFINTLDDVETAEFFNHIVTSGIPIHQPPFWDNISFEVMVKLYSTFGVVPTKFKGIEKPLIVSDIYYIKLKHEAIGKLSARSCGSINLKGSPVKDNRSYKESRYPISTTPVRVGKQLPLITEM